MFFKKLVDEKNDKVKSDFIPKPNEEYTSVTYVCIRFIDRYRFLSNSLDSIVKTLVDKSQKTLKYLKGKIVDNIEILNIVNEIKLLVKDDKYKKVSIRYLKKDYPNEVKNLEDALFNHMGVNDLKLLKIGFPDKWEFPN